MLTQTELDQLNQELRRSDLPDNPLIKLLISARRAHLSLEAVLEHAIRQFLDTIACPETSYEDTS